MTTSDDDGGCPWPELGEIKSDHSAQLKRMFVPGMPIDASVLSDIIYNLVPNQRMNRVVKYLESLNLRINAMDETIQQSLKENPEQIALIEDGAYSAARATTEARIERIVNCVANGLSEAEKVELFSRRLLQLFSDLDDDEVMLLDSYREHAILRQGFGVPRSHASAHATRLPVEVRANSQAGLEKLERLGLLRFIPTVDEVSLDPTGRRGGSGAVVMVPRLTHSGSRVGKYWITFLGLRLLFSIGIVKELPHNADALLVPK